jgi:hypothetical protein
MGNDRKDCLERFSFFLVKVLVRSHLSFVGGGALPLSSSNALDTNYFAQGCP